MILIGVLAHDYTFLLKKKFEVGQLHFKNMVIFVIFPRFWENLTFIWGALAPKVVDQLQKIFFLKNFKDSSKHPQSFEA